MNANIANELIEMMHNDQCVREKLLKEGKLSAGYNPDMERVHRKNASRIEKIIAAIGFPTQSKVGIEASDAAWLIVQHAIGDPRLMKMCYALVAEAISDINPKNFAYLHDRICYFEGRPQRYGTQFDNSGIYPVEDLAQMTRLRKDLQLKELDEDSIIEYSLSDSMVDLHAHDQEFTHWRKKVGWI